MLSLRSLLSLETIVSDEKESQTTTIKSATIMSAEQLYRANHLFQSQKNATPFSYSSMHISNNNHKIHFDYESNVQTTDHKYELSFKLNSARSSIADLRLPFEPSTLSGLSLLEITNNSNVNDNTITLIPTQSIHSFDSSFRSTDTTEDVSMANMSLGNPIFNYSLQIDTFAFTHSINGFDDIKLETFPANNFRFMYQIGHGAFGVVNKSFHLNSCQIVAIKQCRSSNSNAIKSFKKEIAICKEFSDCKYIINMIEYGNMNLSDSKILIALEYMNMGSLNKNQSILNCNNNVQRVKHIAFCILNALDCLHSKLYIHNDIKPANILFNDSGDVKLSDFGCIEQMKDENVPLQKQCGTEYYQSFEKRFVSPVKYTTKSDIYSFGITICELLQQNQQIHNNNNNMPFTIPESIIKKYNQTNTQLIDFLNKCLETDYNKRWSASQLLKHSFLNKKNINDKYIEIEQIEDEDIDDLEFMVNSLIDYYSHYKYGVKPITITNSNYLTPIDSKWSDSQRLENIAKFSGCSVKSVKDFICKNVNKIKDKYLKL